MSIYRAEAIRKALLGDKYYEPSYLHGEMEEFTEALEADDKEEIEEELQDVMYAAQMLAAARAGDRPVIGADDKIREFLRRRDAAEEMFKEKSVPFSVNYLAGGSNIKKPKKIMQFFESAGSPITEDEAADFSKRYTPWESPKDYREGLNKEGYLAGYMHKR